MEEYISMMAQLPPRPKPTDEVVEAVFEEACENYKRATLEIVPDEVLFDQVITVEVTSPSSKLLLKYPITRQDSLIKNQQRLKQIIQRE